tara:strand:+ start:2749 stop:2922 length:174 start_codon:yes stop_codon:yes gene_type:complete
MNNEMKMTVHEMIENATQALKRYDKNDKHWKVLISLLRYKSQEFITMVEKFENGEEE